MHFHTYYLLMLLKVPINISHVLICGRKLENPEKTHMCTRCSWLKNRDWMGVPFDYCVLCKLALNTDSAVGFLDLSEIILNSPLSYINVLRFMLDN